MRSAFPAAGLPSASRCSASSPHSRCASRHDRASRFACQMIERLVPPGGEDEVRALAGLLVDAVETGAAVSFLAPLTIDQAARWWHHTLSTSPSSAIFLVARDD